MRGGGGRASSVGTPIRWTAPWPDVTRLAAGFAVPKGIEHFTIFRGSKERGRYDHHSHLRYHDGRVFLLGNQISGPLSGRDKPGYYRRDPLAVSLSREERAFEQAYAVRAEASPTPLGYGRGFRYPYGAVVGDALWVMYSIGKEDIDISRVPLASIPPRGAGQGLQP